MSERRAPGGILCALITPFRQDQTPDLGALGELIDFQIEQGTHGLFVLGTTGEGVLLESEERRRVAEFAVQRAAGGIPVVIHCGAPDTKTASELARHAASVGAHAAAAVAPYYYRYEEAELYRHFATIAEAAPEIGHYVYENPGVTGYAVGVSLVTRLVKEVPNVHGVKDTGDSIGKVTQYLSQPGVRPQVYVGNNLTILAALVIGAAGSVSALANAVPELVTSLHERWAKGRLEEARDLQFAVAELHGCVAGLPYVGAVKHLVRRRGLPAEGTRAPQSLLTEEQAASLDRRLDAVEGLRPWLEPVEPASSTRSALG